MPDKDVTLTAVWKDDTTTPIDPENPTSEINAMYFVLMPGQGVPGSGVSQGVDKYFPNASDNGGVEGRHNTNGYVGKITKAATELEGAQTTNGYFQVNGVDPDGKYLKTLAIWVTSMQLTIVLMGPIRVQVHSLLEWTTLI